MCRAVFTSIKFSIYLNPNLYIGNFEKNTQTNTVPIYMIGKSFNFGWFWTESIILDLNYLYSLLNYGGNRRKFQSLTRSLNKKKKKTKFKASDKLPPPPS